MAGRKSIRTNMLNIIVCAILDYFAVEAYSGKVSSLSEKLSSCAGSIKINVRIVYVGRSIVLSYRLTDENGSLFIALQGR